jgi:hypothetical protein
LRALNASLDKVSGLEFNNNGGFVSCFEESLMDFFFICGGVGCFIGELDVISRFSSLQFTGLSTIVFIETVEQH